MASAYNDIIDRIINQLDNGVVPWRMAYNYVAKSHSTGRPYSFLNQFLLGKPGTYWTFKQIQDAGHKLKKGCHANHCVFWKVFQVQEKDSDAMRNVPYLKYYNVFHESDIENMEVAVESEESNYNLADEIIANYLMMNPELEFEERSVSLIPPGYSPKADSVRVHEKNQYRSLDEYYSTTFHELVHSTGHKDRLDRFGDNPTDRGKEDYSKEKLVAEIGAAMLCAKCNIKSSIDNSAAYCANWATRIKDNKTWIHWAGKRAEEAMKYMLIGIEEVED